MVGSCMRFDNQREMWEVSREVSEMSDLTSYSTTAQRLTVTTKGFPQTTYSRSFAMAFLVPSSFVFCTNKTFLGGDVHFDN